MARCIPIRIRSAKLIAKTFEKSRPDFAKKLKEMIEICEKKGFKYLPTCKNYDEMDVAKDISL